MDSHLNAGSTWASGLTSLDPNFRKFKEDDHTVSDYYEMQWDIYEVLSTVPEKSILLDISCCYDG